MRVYMEYIFKIIYDKAKKGKVISEDDIYNILSLIISKKDLSSYIQNMNVQSIRSNYLASYCGEERRITVYTNTIDRMLKEIESDLIDLDDFGKRMYENLSILQVILHEVEHANQKRLVSSNTPESLLIRSAYLVDYDSDNETLYETCPIERLAEIKSYREIESMIKEEAIDKDLEELIVAEKTRRELLGYHYQKDIVSIPLYTYFSEGGKPELLHIFPALNEEIELPERLKFGYLIEKDEYSKSLTTIVNTYNKNFKNKVLIKK